MTSQLQRDWKAGEEQLQANGNSDWVRKSLGTGEGLRHVLQRENTSSLTLKASLPLCENLFVSNKVKIILT